MKQTTKLNNRSLHPHGIERQNVQLVFIILCDSTVAGLQTLGLQHQQLPNLRRGACLCKTILNCLNIVHFKSLYKGNTRDRTMPTQLRTRNKDTLDG